MNLTYLVNPKLDTSIVQIYKSTDPAITIAPGASYVSPSFEVGDYSFFRFYANFDANNIEKNITDIEFFIETKPKGVAFDATAVGIASLIPVKATQVLLGSLDLVAHSDGDVPFFDNNFRIVVKNNKTVNHILRNITVFKTK